MSMMRGGNMSLMRRMAADPEVAQHQLTRGVVRRILAFAKPYRGLIIVFIGLVVLSSALAVAPPLLFKLIIDEGVLKQNRQLVIILGATVAGLAVLQAVIGLVQRWCSSTIGEGLIFDLRTQVFDHVRHDAAGLLHPHPDRQAGVAAELRRDRRPAGLHLDAVHRAVQRDQPGAGAGRHAGTQLAAHPGRAGDAADLPDPGQDRRPQAGRADPAADAAERGDVDQHDRAVQRQRRAAGRPVRPAARRARPVRGQGRRGPRRLGQDRDERPLLHDLARSGRGPGHGAGVRRRRFAGHRRRC